MLESRRDRHPPGPPVRAGAGPATSSRVGAPAAERERDAAPRKALSSSGTSQEANAAASIRAVAWIRRRSRRRRGRAPEDLDVGAELLRQPAAGRRDDEQGQLGGEQAGGQQREQPAGVGADDGRPAVALEIAPLRRALVEVVVVVGDGPRLDPDGAAGEVEAEAEVGVLLIEEVGLAEAAELRPGIPPDRQAGAGGKGDLLRLGRSRRARRPRPARPGDPGEVDDAAATVDPGAALVGDEPLPRSPAAALGQGQLDRVAEAGSDDVVGVEEEQQIAAGPGRSEVAGRAEARIPRPGEQGRGRRELGDDGGRGVGGAVVADDQLVPAAQLGDDRRQRAPQRRRRVVGDDHDGERRRDGCVVS